MEIIYSDRFKLFYKSRIKRNEKLRKLCIEKIKTFQSDPDDATLDNHKLYRSMQGLYSFSINGDIRIIYKWKDSDVIFLDIGKHSQVYKKNKK